MKRRRDRRQRQRQTGCPVIRPAGTGGCSRRAAYFKQPRSLDERAPLLFRWSASVSIAAHTYRTAHTFLLKTFVANISPSAIFIWELRALSKSLGWELSSPSLWLITMCKSICPRYCSLWQLDLFFDFIHSVVHSSFRLCSVRLYIFFCGSGNCCRFCMEGAEEGQLIIGRVNDSYIQRFW